MFPVLFLVALASVVVMAPAATVYWDAFGYVLQAINGDVGGLGLGRPVFVLTLHGIARGWLAAGGSPWQLEVVLRVACAVAAATAAPLTARLALDCGLERRIAWMAGLAVALSPAMAHASGQVLADGPGVSFLLVACVLAARATNGSIRLALGSGLALGLAVGVREQTIVNVLTLAWCALLAPRPGRWRVARAMAIGFVAAFALPLVFVALTQPAYLDTVREWLANMGRDRIAKTYGWHDLVIYVGWLVSLGPVVVIAGLGAIAGAIRQWRWRASVLAAIAVPALLQVMWMATFRGVGYSPRFLLAALPAAFAMPASVLIAGWAGDSRVRWRLAIAGWVLPLVVAVPVTHARSADLVATLRDWPARLRSLPASAVIVSGQPCPAIPLVRAVVGLDVPPAPDWRPVCPGWAWPAHLADRLDSALAEGHVVAADLRDASWTGAEQRAARDELDRYVAARTDAESSGQLIVWRGAPQSRR